MKNVGYMLEQNLINKEHEKMLKINLFNQIGLIKTENKQKFNYSRQ